MAVDVRARRVDLLITSDTMPLVGTRLAEFRLVFLSSFFCFVFFGLFVEKLSFKSKIDYEVKTTKSKHV